MIVSFFIDIAYGFIWAITEPFRLLPDASLPTALSSSISTASGYLTAVDFIFPVGTFLTIFLLILSIEAFITLWKIVNWIIRKIPTIS